MTHLPKLTRDDLVFEVMADGKSHTLAELSKKTGFPEASVSAALRAFRRLDFTLTKGYDQVGRVWQYRLEVRDGKPT